MSTRRTLPFCEARGGTGTWSARLDKGFVGGTLDNTGLTHNGAREYDPALARFINEGGGWPTELGRLSAGLSQTLAATGGHGMNAAFLDDVNDASRLVSYACRPRMRPLTDKVYNDLLDRYRSSSEFRDLVDSVADGIGLEPIAAHPEEGLVVHPQPEHLFRSGSSTIRRGSSLPIGWCLDSSTSRSRQGPIRCPRISRTSPSNASRSRRSTGSSRRR